MALFIACILYTRVKTERLRWIVCLTLVTTQVPDNGSVNILFAQVWIVRPRFPYYLAAPLDMVAS